MRGEICIGISGWRYAGWRGRFYPNGLPQRRELEYASRKFGTIEINGTHYSLQRPEYFAQWAAETPEDFVFAVKGSRYITHMLQLKNAAPALANFFAQGVLKLGHKLGPILWQFPPRFVFRPEKLKPFLAALPYSTGEAARIAKAHDHRVQGRAFTEALVDQPLRHAVEIRHESFRDPGFIALLRKHNVALVVADAVDWPLLMDVTSDFVYVRLHGSKKLYTSGYGPKALDRWAACAEAWAAGRDAPDGERASPVSARKAARRDVYIYFDNDAKVRAPVDALALEKRLRLKQPAPDAAPARVRSTSRAEPLPAAAH